MWNPESSRNVTAAHLRRWTYSDYVGWIRDVFVSLALLLPLLAAYEALVIYYSVDLRNSAEILLKDLSGILGNLTIWLQRLVIVFTLVVGARVLQRNVPLLRIYPLFLLESTLIALLLGPLASWVLAAFGVKLAPQETSDHSWVLSLGAGVYEELVFRLLVLAGTFSLLQRVVHFQSRAAYGAALIVSAISFSLYHHLGPHGEPFDLGVALFRFVAGILLGVLFLLRGLASCAYVHSLYDLFCDLRVALLLP